MFDIVIYSFKKKSDSTKRPTAQNVLENTKITGVLKQTGCGINDVIVQVNYGPVKGPTNYNYAWIPIFKRYYFVRDWVFIDGLWEGHFVEDFLATWKPNILNYNAYVLRSASDYNTNISDPLCPTLAQTAIVSKEIENPFNLAGGGELPTGEGEYIIGINSKNDTPYGSSGTVTYYALPPISMQNLGNYLMSNIDYLKIDWNADAKKFLTPELLKTLFNPIQYIASCRWYPIVPADLGTDVNKIPFGFWDIDVIGRRLSPREMVQTEVRSIEIPKHPQSGTYGKWLNLNPYTTYQLHVSPYGIIDVPADELLNATEVAVECVIDYSTGDARMMVASNSRFISIQNFEFGADVQLSQLSQNGIGALTSGLQYQLTRFEKQGLRFGQALSKANITGIAGNEIGTVEAGLNFIGDIANCMTPTIQSVGGRGARAWYYTGEIFWRLSAKFVYVGDPGAAVNGRPLCAFRTLGDLSGYAICEGASVEFEGNRIEQDAVNAYLNRGFYIE